jgi:hypothetical protein
MSVTRGGKTRYTALCWYFFHSLLASSAPPPTYPAIAQSEGVEAEYPANMSICHPKRMHRPDVPGQASSKGPRMRRKYLGSARVQECQFVWCVPRQLVWCVPCMIDRCSYNVLSIYKSAKCRVHPTTHGTTHNTLLWEACPLSLTTHCILCFTYSCPVTVLVTMSLYEGVTSSLCDQPAENRRRGKEAERHRM